MATLKDVFHDRPIQLVPYIVNEKGFGEYIENITPVTLTPQQSLAFIEHLVNSHNTNVIEESLQGICKRTDGTLLKSAMPSYSEFTRAIQGIDTSVFAELLNALPYWHHKGCNEVMIHFEERR